MRFSPIHRSWLLIAAALLLSGCGINAIPTLDEEVSAAWSQVLNQYKRRADLIPNLEETVKGAAKQEREVLVQVTQARSRVAQTQLPRDVLTNPEALAQFQKNQDALSQALARLMVVVERYPEIKSSQNFLTLQAQLEGAENRISVARRDFIDAVRRYNTELRTIPGRWYAAWFYPDAKPKANFTQPDSVQEAPKLKF